MGGKEREVEPKQKTQPKKGKPVEIPVPTRDAVLHDLEKIATPERKDDERKRRSPDGL